MVEFQLTLFNRTKRSVQLILGWLGLALVSPVVVFGLRDTGAALLIYGYFGLLLLGAFWVYRAYKKEVLAPSTVSITPTELRVRDLRQNQVTLAVRYADIAAYRYQSFNGSEELRLTLATAQREFIKANSNLAEVRDFAAMVRAFEHQLATPPAGCGGEEKPGEVTSTLPLGIVREKSFFEKSVSTVCLVIFTAMLVFIIGWVVTGALPFRGNFLVVGGIYFSYLAAWLAAASQRRQR